MAQTTNGNSHSGDLPTGGPLPHTFGFSKLTPGENQAPDPQLINTALPAPVRKRKPLEKKLNISDLVKVMYRGRWIILVTFIAVFAYSVYDSYSKPFIYASSTRMFIDKPPGSSQVAKIIGGSAAEED